jgi:hypothetical protein
LTSQGQVAFYAGSDPGDANDWSLIGVFDMARPLGTRCMVKVGGDLYINTEIGILPLSQALKTDPAALGTIALTQNIAQEINLAARRYKSNFGWQIMAYPKGKMAIMNVPVSEGENQVQFVMNTQTGAWCKFTNQNANCWEVMDGRLFFGGNAGKVYEADSAGTDGGSDIVGDMQTYFDAFGQQSRLKAWKMIRPIIYTNGTTSPQVGLNVDYSSTKPTGTIQAATANVTNWNESTWGGGYWTGGLTLNAKWRSITDKPGYVAAVRMVARAAGQGNPIQLQVNGFDITYELGGVM